MAKKKVFVGVLAVIREEVPNGHLFKRFEWVPAKSNEADDMELDAGLFKDKMDDSDWSEALEAVCKRTAPWSHPAQAVTKPAKKHIGNVFLSMAYPIYFDAKSAKVHRLVQGLQDDLADNYEVGESLAAFFSGRRDDDPRLNDLFNELLGEISRIMMAVPPLVPVGQTELEAIKAMKS